MLKILVLNERYSDVTFYILVVRSAKEMSPLSETSATMCQEIK